jgi:hypothetical protein
MTDINLLNELGLDNLDCDNDCENCIGGCSIERENELERQSKIISTHLKAKEEQ